MITKEVVVAAGASGVARSQTMPGHCSLVSGEVGGGGADKGRQS